MARKVCIWHTMAGLMLFVNNNCVSATIAVAVMPGSGYSCCWSDVFGRVHVRSSMRVGKFTCEGTKTKNSPSVLVTQISMMRMRMRELCVN